MALMRINFFSEVLGLSVGADVILPQYADPPIGPDAPIPDKKFPVLWLLHGASDNHTIWQRRTAIERYVDPLGLAVVMPNALLSSYTDMEHGGKYYTFISQELPRLMRSFFPLSDKREENFIAGLSMGGQGCLKIGLANPENYAAIGCFSAGLSNFSAARNTPARQKRQYLLYGEREVEGTVDDPFNSARRIIEEGLPVPRVYHACGTEDFLLENARATRDFFGSFQGNPFDYTYEEYPGAHTWEFWDEHIQNFLKFIGMEPTTGYRT